MTPRSPGARRPANRGQGRPRRHRGRREGGGTGRSSSPLLTPPGRGRAPAPAAAQRMRCCGVPLFGGALRACASAPWYTGARVGLHVVKCGGGLVTVNTVTPPLSYGTVRMGMYGNGECAQ